MQSLAMARHPASPLLRKAIMSDTFRKLQQTRLSKEQQIERAYQQKAARERRETILANSSKFDQLFLAFKQKESK